jgi:hypothetical protein
MHVRILVIAICSLIINKVSLAQDKSSFKFGKVSPADFTQPVPSFDSGAHAVVLGDVGSCKMVGNNSGGFGYEFERKLRVRILDINGVDAGKFKIPLYFSKNGESRDELQSIKGITYNLEGKQVVETKLEPDQVFSEKLNKQYTAKKFSLPALKAGSICEISYRITSDFIFELHPWDFQGDYPGMYSEYKVEIPQFYNYVFLLQGYLPFFASETTQSMGSFMIRGKRELGLTTTDDTYVVRGLVNQKRWVLKNIPALKEENFTTTIENHRNKLEFQLSSIHYPDSDPKPIMDTWPKISEELMKKEEFGMELEKVVPWLDDIVLPLTSGSKNQLETANRIFAFVRDHFTCTSGNSIFTSNGLKNLLKTKNGNIAEINLLLLALLKHSGIESYPVILSTRSQGITNEQYPLIDRFNYLICAAKIGQSQYLLDAGIPQLGFGKLDPKCYNGHARILTPETRPIYLSPDSVTERKITFALLKGENNQLKGSIQSNPGFFESFRQRDIIKEKGLEEVFTKIKTTAGIEIAIYNTGIDSLSLLDIPLKVHYDFDMKMEDADLYYLNPLLGNGFKENPFKSNERNYPVEMNYKMDDIYVLTFEIPEGYEVEELPKSAKVTLNESDGYFEYLISYDGSSVHLRTRLLLSKATFLPVEYESLREFFGYVVKKQAEQIVIKKAHKK